jgi:cytochrome c
MLVPHVRDWPPRLPPRLLIGVVGMAAVLLSAACVPDPSARGITGASAPIGRATVDQGQKIYQADCASCHGDKGDRVPVAPLNSKEFLDSRGDATLVTSIADGKGVMPAAGKLHGGPRDDDEIRATVAYLNLYAGRSSPALLAGTGRALFEQNCVRCHGDKGDRIPVAPLSAKAFIDSRTDAELLETIDDGKGIMPGFGTGAKSPLSDEQSRALVSYLRFGAESSMAERARQGRELYLGNCLACHGERGDRIPNITLASPDYLRKLGDGALISAIAEGKGVMPGFSRFRGGTFDVAEVASVLMYMKTWSGLPAGSALTGVEQPSEGRDIFAKNCTACHGETGDRVSGVRLKSREFLDARTDDGLARVINQGNARGMPAWGEAEGGPLRPEDVKKVTDYLRSVAVTTSGVTAGAQPRSGAPTPASGAAALAQQTGNPATSGGDPAKGKALIGQKGCGVCHTIPGIDGANGTVGPNLTGVGGRPKIAGGAVDNKGAEDLAKWIVDPPSLKPGTAMPKIGLTSEEASHVAAYLESPDVSGAADGGAPPAAPAQAATPPSAPAAAPATGAAQTTTVPGDATKGKEVITTRGCGGCHTIPGVAGANGVVGPNLQGVATRPKIAGGAVANTGPEDLKKWIMDPPSLKPGTAMPKLGLSEEEATNVAAYLSSAAVSGGPAGAPPPGGAGPDNTGGGPPQAGAAGGQAPAAAAAPVNAAEPLVAINATVGRELFGQNCLACHGENGLRQANCPLGSPEWLANMSDEGLRTRISNGKPPAGMPTWSKRKGGPLSDSQIEAIMQYLPALASSNSGVVLAARP